MTRPFATALLLPLLFGCAQPGPEPEAAGLAQASPPAPQATTGPAMQATINGFARGTTTYDQAVAALGQPASSQSQPDGYRMVTYREAPAAQSGSQGGMLQQGMSTLASSGRFSNIAGMMPRQGQPAAARSYQLVFDRSGTYQGVSTASPTSTTSGIIPSQLLRYLPGST